MVSESTESSFDFLSRVQSAPVQVDMWFAMVGREVVSQGPDLQVVIAEAKSKRPGQRLFVGRLPSDHTMLL